MGAACTRETNAVGDFTHVTVKGNGDRQMVFGVPLKAFRGVMSREDAAGLAQQTFREYLSIIYDIMHSASAANLAPADISTLISNDTNETDGVVITLITRCHRDGANAEAVVKSRHKPNPKHKTFTPPIPTTGSRNDPDEILDHLAHVQSCAVVTHFGVRFVTSGHQTTFLVMAVGRNPKVRYYKQKTQSVDLNFNNTKSLFDIEIPLDKFVGETRRRTIDELVRSLVDTPPVRGRKSKLKPLLAARHRKSVSPAVVDPFERRLPLSTPNTGPIRGRPANQTDTIHSLFMATRRRIAHGTKGEVAPGGVGRWRKREKA
jgi:hypothetical protein